MAGIELLITRTHVGAEARNICSRGLEVIERLKIRIVGEVVVEAEILARVNVVIEAESELVLCIGAGRYGLIVDAVGPICSGDEAEHIDRDRILAGGGDRRISVAVSGKDSDSRLHLPKARRRLEWRLRRR